MLQKLEYLSDAYDDALGVFSTIEEEAAVLLKEVLQDKRVKFAKALKLDNEILRYGVVGNLVNNGNDWFFEFDFWALTNEGRDYKINKEAGFGDDEEVCEYENDYNGGDWETEFENEDIADDFINSLKVLSEVKGNFLQDSYKLARVILLILAKGVRFL